MLRLDRVTKTFAAKDQPAVTAVRAVSLRIATGEFVVITGRSGSGKTTLLNLVAGLARPTTGTVWLEGADLWRLDDNTQSRLRSQKIGFIFQFRSLMPALTVLENVALPRLFSGRHRQPAEPRAAELLATVGLADKLHAYPRQLSAGQQQRVVIARALINHPAVLLADEPTSNLDEQTEGEIMDLFQQIHRERGLTIVLVTHTRQLIHYGTRALEMAAGQVTADSATEAASSEAAPRLVRA